MPTRQYRNDSETEYNIPGLGWVGPGQRVSFSGEFPPPINLDNYPGLVDVIAEETPADENTDSVTHDYEANPEPAYTPPAEDDLAILNPGPDEVAAAPPEPPAAPAEGESQNG